MNRREFVQQLVCAATLVRTNQVALYAEAAGGRGAPAASIANDYYDFLPSEREALEHPPLVRAIADGAVSVGQRTLHPDDFIDGWCLLVIADINGVATAVFEKRVTHRGVIVWVTADRGAIASMPTFIGDLAAIKPRPVTAPPAKQLTRPRTWSPGPDISGDYILQSSGDPSWNTVAALGPEFLGWTLVANEQAGPERSLFLTEDGTSRELNNNPPQASWAPDELSPVLDPQEFFPSDNVQVWQYEKGWSKRTLLGGYTPTANIAVWNPQYQCGYEIASLLPEGEDVSPVSRVLIMVPEDQVTPGMRVFRDGKGRAFVEHFQNGNRARFFSLLLGIWLRWHTLFEESMPVHIPDENLRDSARAGIMLARCSYRGLRPTYQIGEGAYTKIPESSHALFPVAAYEFVWAQQLWGLSADATQYLQFYLDHYILPDGNFLYNTQDQVEAPLNVGLFARNVARAYFYTRDLAALQAALPALRRMLGYVFARAEWSRNHFQPDDPHYGLIWGSPEADLGDPQNDAPASHPLYFQNTANIWRGLVDLSSALQAASRASSPNEAALSAEAAGYSARAAQLHTDLERSITSTMARRSAAMKQAAIAPFTPEDIARDPRHLLSYENHRFMQDWFLADWTDPSIDLGHLQHRRLAGLESVGLHMDGGEPRTSNFMEHGTLAVRIRQPDYRPFLLTLYGLVAFTADTGSRYSPEDALLPGGFAGEGNKYWWSAVVNSVLQPTVGLRWLLCYEEADQPLVHLQKAAPCEWFAPGQRIAVGRCPTRFGAVGWTTLSRDIGWSVTLDLPETFATDLLVHIHPPDRAPLRQASVGTVQGSAVRLERAALQGKRRLEVTITR